MAEQNQCKRWHVAVLQSHNRKIAEWIFVFILILEALSFRCFHSLQRFTKASAVRVR